MNLLELISTRKSVRKYSDKDITNEDLKTILESARLAPSWMNVQPWKFIVVKSQENKDLLCELSIGQPQVKNAKALIVCVADQKAWEESKITGIQNPALNPALQCENGILIRTLEQIIYPISYMMLTSHSLGISSCIIGAFGSEITGILPEISSRAKQILGLDNNQIISTIITLGYEDTAVEAVKQRKSFDDIIFLEKIGQKFN